MAVALSAGTDVEEARKTAVQAANMLKVEVNHVQ